MPHWNRPDPLTRDLIHLINARRHDHGDADAAVETLQAFLDQDREDDLLTVLAALDEEMAEWLFDLLAEAACSIMQDGEPDERPTYAVLGALELPLQANLPTPLRLRVDPVATADLLHKHLHLPPGTVVRTEARLLTDATLDLFTLHNLFDHTSSLAETSRRHPLAHRLHAPVESTAYLLFELMGSPEPGLPESLDDEDRRLLLAGLVAQCPELASAPHMLEAPVFAAYAMFDAQNAVRLHRLADETIAVWRELDPIVRSRTIVHLHTQCGNGVYMPVWTDLFDPELPEDHGPVWTSPDVWVFTADLPIEWPGEMLTNRLLAEGCTRFENHIVEAPDN
ncbi:MAG: hypothetical protein A4S17_01280 [Proteobacteria bacterium HN_bin10]|nr:MAG: hypothetical protein A4S17_01280 [Proteobacteria bacterium HN_bin10]